MEYRRAASPHPKVLEGPAWVQCQGIRPSCRARAAFELFAAPGPATQEWARLFATLKSDAPGRLDAIDDPANAHNFRNFTADAKNLRGS